ncbi:hypothetical protein [Streptomyces sp. WM6373]|uniref:hypothetical protein n=1 Tax=Streptomyces sp. WM6373 TaxID=1415556 RepID=UPI0006AF487B|nr:hypothetical protein [Streptomyces sp. WM6373]
MTSKTNPLVDATPARQHARSLMAAGVSIAVTAHRAGLRTSALSNLLYTTNGRPPAGRIRESKAMAILGVKASEVVTGRVNATGTRRRLQALTAIGWPQVHIAPHIPCHPLYVWSLAQQDIVLARTAHRVAAAYELLWNKDPVRHGVPANRVSYVRRLAERNGWLPPAAWDDDLIDDPAAQPEQPEEMGFRELAAYRREEILHLAAFGIPEHDIAARLGMSTDYVTTKLRELRAAA